MMAMTTSNSISVNPFPDPSLFRLIKFEDAIVSSMMRFYGCSMV
jgi:hypothetical protein